MKMRKQVLTTLFLLPVFLVLCMYQWGIAISHHNILTKDLQNETDLAGIHHDIVQFIQEQQGFQDLSLDLYGMFSQSLGKHELRAFHDVVDKEGYWYDGNFYNAFGANQKELGMQVRLFHDMAASFSSEFFVSMGLERQVRPEYAYRGIPYASFTKQKTEFLRALRYYGVSYLDLEASDALRSLAYEDCYYRSGKTWKGKAALYGYVEVLNWLQTQNGSPIDDADLTKLPEHYEQVVYPSMMFGEKGEEVGHALVQPEDYEVYIPKQSGAYQLRYGTTTEWTEVSGAFDEILIKRDIDGEKNLNAYEASYQYQDHAYVSIRNLKQPQGQKILILRDDDTLPICAYFAQNYAQVDSLSLAKSDRSILQGLMMEEKYDTVLLLISPSSLQQENFQFYQEVNHE